MVPLPRSHLHDTAPPVLASVKEISTGAQPSVTEALNCGASWALLLRLINSNIKVAVVQNFVLKEIGKLITIDLKLKTLS